MKGIAMMTDSEIRTWILTNTTVAFNSFQVKNGKVNVDGTIRLHNSVEHIPFQFDNVTSDFDCGFSLKSLDGVPEYCNVFKCRSMFIKDFSKLPECQFADLIGSSVKNLNDLLSCMKCDMRGINISSIAGLKSFRDFDASAVPYNLQALDFSSAYIAEGGLGLLLIQGLLKMNPGSQINGQRNWDGTVIFPDKMANAGDAFAIISKYVGQPDDIFHCQSELFDNGLGKYAEL